MIGDGDHDHNADNGEGDKSGQTREGEQGVVHLKTVMMKMMKAILIYPTYILYPVMMKEFCLQTENTHIMVRIRPIKRRWCIEMFSSQILQLSFALSKMGKIFK